MKMEILVPVSTDFRNAEILYEAKKTQLSNVDIMINNIKQGPTSIECDYDSAFAENYVVEMAEEMETNGANGIVLYCFAEPALSACKEKLNIPVVGLREAPIAIASLLGDNIGVIAPMENTKKSFSRALGNKVRQIISLDLPVLEYADQEKVRKAIESKIQQLVQNNCDVIVFGCGSILGLDIEHLQDKYHLPIIVPIHAAVAVCEYLMQHKLMQSKIAYPTPVLGKVIH
jgi:allantoin racemase